MNDAGRATGTFTFLSAKRWTDEQWREIRKETPNVLRERERIRKEGWFN